MTRGQIIKNKLNSLSKSKFRSSFKLKSKDIEYIKKIGIYKLREHAYDFISERLAPSHISNDGHQTPTKGHPVFIAQHATATCCRECLFKWHHIEKNKNLNNNEINYIVTLILEWIKNNYQSSSNKL